MKESFLTATAEVRRAMLDNTRILFKCKKKSVYFFFPLQIMLKRKFKQKLYYCLTKLIANPDLMSCPPEKNLFMDAKNNSDIHLDCYYSTNPIA